MGSRTGWGGVLSANCESSEITSGSPASEKRSPVSHETHPVKSAAMVSTPPVVRGSACVGKSDEIFAESPPPPHPTLLPNSLCS